MRTLVILLLAALLTGGCRQPAAVPVALEEVVHPDLAAVEEVVRRQLEERRARLERALAKGAERRELANAFGALGELYHAYALLPPAAACYRNAERLDGESLLWPYYLGAAEQAAGNFEAARRALEHTLELRADPPTLLRLGEVELARGDPAAARSRFEPLLGEAQYAAAAHFGLGRAAAAGGDAGAAVEHFRRVLELQPGAGSVHHSLGMALRQLDRRREAAAELERQGAGEVRSPDPLMERVEELAVSSGAFLRRGNQALMGGRLDEAAELFRRAVQADPKNVAARRNLAIALLRLGDLDGALDALREAAEVSSEDVWVHFDLGNVYLRKGLVDQAIRSFRRAVELAPDFVKAHFNLANALIGAERWEEARPHLEAVLELDPGERRARYLMAMARHRKGETAAAIADLRKLLDEEPTNLVARQGLASIFAGSRQVSLAASVYRDGLELEIPPAEKVQLLYPLAEMLWKDRRRQAAIEQWRRAVELQGDSSRAHTLLANGLQLVGEREEARQHFARAVELDPSNATAWLSEARLWILDKEFAAARQRLEAALEHLPDEVELIHTLARLLATCGDPEVRDGQRALALAREAYHLEANLERAETVAMALAELGHFEEAIKWQNSLIQRVAMSGDRDALRRLTENLRRYQGRQPVRMAG